LGSSPGDRHAFVRERCGDDEELRREVESLLSFEAISDSLIDSSPDAIAAEMFFEAENEPRLIGETIGHYRITELLGVGGMGQVYLASDSVLNRKVALKLLSRGLTEHADRLKRFKHEALASSALNHPNIVTIHEFGSENESNYIVTEFVDGDTLRQKMSGGPLSVSETLNVALQTASALAAAHDAGIVHRDIKPENIMIRNDGLVKVLDFGLAKLTAPPGPYTGTDEQTLFKTEPGMVMGTVGYMSPEQARGVHVDARTDIWSLGVIMYEMAAGRRPFEGPTQTDILVAILSKNVPMIEIYVDDSLAELGRIIDKTLAKNAEERYHSAEELVADLKRFRQRLEFEAEMKRPDPADHETVMRMIPAVGTAPASLPAMTGGGRGKSRKAMLIAAIGLLAVASVAVVVWQSNILTSDTARIAAPVAPAVPDPDPAAASRFLTYSLTVQSFTDGRYKDPFTLSGEMLFRNKDRIRLNIKAAQTGHLYILNQGPKDDYGEATFNILFPTPMTNDGLAQLGAGQEIQIPRQTWFQLDEKEGTELVWLVWSEQPLSAIEAAKRFANPDDKGRIKDQELSRMIDSLLQKQQSNKVNVERDDNTKESRIGANTDIVAHIIKLEHH
jgi:serine/threonine protein kinase